MREFIKTFDVTVNAIFIGYVIGFILKLALSIYVGFGGF